MKIKTLLLYLSLLPLLTSVVMAPPPLGTAFTYQGRLTVGAGSANGSYDLQSTLYDASSGGSIIGGPVTNAAVPISNGLFAVSLDLGAGVFLGDPRWLEIGVRTNGGGAFITLSPRQPLTPSPYAFYAPSAGSAASAATATLANSVAAGSVLNSSLAANAVTSDKIADGTIVNADVNATTGISGSKIIGGDLQAARLKVGNSPALSGSYSTVAGGSGNIATNDYAVVGGGQGNRAGGVASAVLGGQDNHVDGNYSTIAGGFVNVAITNYAVVSGGLHNRAGGAASAVVGGEANHADGPYSTAMGAVNIAIGYGSTAIGVDNTASGYYSTAMGYSSTASGTNSTAMGYDITAGGNYSTAMGYRCEANDAYSMAAGHLARALHQGAHVWADSQNSYFESTGNDQFLIRAAGGIGVNTNNPQTALHVCGDLTLDAGADPTLYTGVGDTNLNRYLCLINSKGWMGASGLKAGGILVSDNYYYANPAKSNLIVQGYVGVGTNNPQATLDVNGSFRINRGTTFTRVQDGVFVAGPGSGVLVVTNVFPTAFNNAPNVLLSAINASGTDWPDVFCATVRRATTTNVVVNIVRVDSTAAWSQNLRIAYHAWE